MSWAIQVRPKPVMAAKMPSPRAAPRPETKPFSGPKAKLRRMQIRLTGPIGAAAISPITIPDRMR